MRAGVKIQWSGDGYVLPKGLICRRRGLSITIIRPHVHYELQYRVERAPIHHAHSHFHRRDWTAALFHQLLAETAAIQATSIRLKKRNRERKDGPLRPVRQLSAGFARSGAQGEALLLPGPSRQVPLR